MSIRKVKLVPGLYYHIYNRGNSKQTIFHNTEDYLRFIGLLYACNQKRNLKVCNLNKDQTLYDLDRAVTLVNIGAYCIMPNHFHLLIMEQTEKGISNFLQKVSTAYSMYYNKKYKRTGGLYEGKFKSQHLNTDRYLKYLFSYIHLNPLKLIQKDWKERGIINKKDALLFLKKYKYSSYMDFIGEKRIQNKVLNLELFPKYFPSVNSFNREIFDWLNYKNSQVLS